MIIYKIENKINNKIYIGQTINTLKERIKGHEYAYKKYDYPLYLSMRKYGKENFKVDILYKAQSYEELNEKEKYYIKKYKSHKREYGYNILIGGNNSKKPKEIRLKIGKAQEGNKNHMYGKTGWDNPTSKPVKCLNDNKIYASATEAAKHYFPDMKYGFSRISEVCRGRRKSVNGVYFEFAKGVKNRYKYKKPNPKNRRSHKVNDIINNKEYNQLTSWVREKGEYSKINTIWGSIINRGYYIDMDKNLCIVSMKGEEFKSVTIEDIIRREYKYKVKNPQEGTLKYYKYKMWVLKDVFGDEYKDSYRKRYTLKGETVINKYIIKEIANC